MSVQAFDASEIRRMGVSFETEEETVLFLSVLSEELQRRIDRTGILPEVFDPLPADDPDDDMLLCDPEMSRTELSAVTERCRAALRREIMQYRGQIAGCLPGLPDELLQTEIEALELSIRSFNCLKRAGINTLADILAHGELSDIRNIGRRGVDEVEEKLRSLGL
jgi:hypothetical protein